MLSNIPSTKYKSIASLCILTKNFITNTQQNQHVLTQQHIKQADTITKLLKNTKLFQLSQQKYFQPFMYKLTRLLIEKKWQNNKQDIEYLQKLMLEIRKYSSAQVHATSSDLLNYQLIFKILTQQMKEKYVRKGFQYRATLVTQQLPKVISFEENKPVAMALLHYTATQNLLSTDELKKNLHNYFTRYFLSQKLINSQFKGLNSQQKSQNKFDINPHTFAILLNSMNLRNKNATEIMIDTLSLNNLNKYIKFITSYFGGAQVIKHYYQKYSKKEPQQLSIEQLNQFMRVVYRNPNFAKYKNFKDKNGKPILVINTKLSFLQIFGMYINTIQYQYKNLFRSQVCYNAVKYLTVYLYMVVLSSQNMSINVSTSTVNQFQLPANNSSSKQPIVQVTHLWKIFAQVLQAFAMNKIYIAQKQKFSYLILLKLITFLKKNITLPSEKKQSKQKKQNYKNQSMLKQNQFMKVLQGYEDNLIKIVLFTPTQTFEKIIKEEPKALQYLAEGIIICTRKVTQEQSKNYFNVVNSLIKLAKYKKSLILNKNQWIQVFKMIINRDKKYMCWNFYFFLAQTGDKNFINLIPFDLIINSLSKKRVNLDKDNLYKPSNQQTAPKATDLLKEQIYENWRKQTFSSLNWEIDVLRLHALMLMVNTQKQIKQLLSKKSVQYVITLEEVENIFHKWLQPFKAHMLGQAKGDQLRNPYFNEVDFKFNLANSLSITPHYHNYFIQVFIKTECFNQPKLIHKILTNPIVQNYVLYFQTHSRYNFLPFMMTILHGFSDAKHKSLYLKKYPYQSITPPNFRKNSFFKFPIEDNIPYFYEIQQWQYLLNFLKQNGSVSNVKSIFSPIHTNQNIYDKVVIQLKQQSNNSLLKQKNHNSRNKLDLTSVYNLSNIKKVVKYTNDELTFINNLIIENTLNEMVDSNLKPYTLMNRLIYVSNYLYQWIHQLPNFTIKKQLLTQKQKQILRSSIKKSLDIFDSKNLGIAFLKYYTVGFFTDQLAIQLFFKNYNDFGFSLSNYFCIAILGKQKALKNKLINNQEQWKQISRKSLQQANKSLASLVWAFVFFKTVDINQIHKYSYLWNRMYNPNNRKFIMDQIRKRMEKQNIKNQKLNFNEFESHYVYDLQKQQKFDEQYDFQYLQKKDKIEKNQKSKPLFKKKSINNSKKQNQSISNRDISNIQQSKKDQEKQRRK